MTKVTTLLNTLGAKRGPKLPKVGYDAYVEFQKRGVSLIFEDEAYLKQKKGVALGKSPLVLVGAFFHSEGYDDYQEFQGALPKEISFRDAGAGLP